MVENRSSNVTTLMLLALLAAFPASSPATTLVAEYDKFLDEWSSMDTDTALKTYAESIWTQTTSWGGPYQGEKSQN